MEIKFNSYIYKRCHKNCITSLSVFGDKIASGGKDSTVLIHQKHNSELKCLTKYNLAELNGIKCNVTSVDYREELVIASTTVGVVNIIDHYENENIKFKAHKNEVSCVKFFTDNMLITSGFDNKVRLWDIRNLKLPTQELLGHTASVNYIDSLPVEEKDDSLVSFGETFEKILSSASDKTVRLWNVNAGTHLVFKIPMEMSQNVESCCLITKTPNYMFAVGLDDNYLLIYSAKLKNHIYQYSFGANVSINCIRHYRGLIILGTNEGDLCVFKLENTYDDDDHVDAKENSTSDGTNSNGVTSGYVCELVNKTNLKGSVNDIVVIESENGEIGNSMSKNTINLTVYVALGTEVRLGRWLTVDSKEVKNQIIIQQITINIR